MVRQFQRILLMVMIERGQQAFIGISIYSHSRIIPSNSSSSCRTRCSWVLLFNRILDPLALRLGID